ncbi:MAG: toxin-antitoxin system antitoxin subunit [Bifidobacteriaceae bacterium]|jgi:hypothetical protein|nr:toxin-antitoxin system antitoxin subunit [Bifidobacteriaceae bacterium]
MDHIGENGVVITDEMLDKWADDAEHGIYHGTPGPLITRKQFGRPRVYDEPMVSVSVRLPASDVRQAKKRARESGTPFPNFVREVFRAGLESPDVVGSDDDSDDSKE